MFCLSLLSLCGLYHPTILTQGGPASVAVAAAVEREVSTGVQFVATVVPPRTSRVGSAVAGRVDQYPILEGHRVAEGETLAHLRTGTREIELAMGRAELTLRQQELEELLSGSRPEEIEQARAAMLAAQARMEYARKDLARVGKLFETDSAASDEFDAASSRAEETYQDYLEKKAALELATKGPRDERINQARARVAMQEEQVRWIEDQLEKYAIVAPFDGYVAARHTELGEWIQEGDVVATVIELDAVEVRALVVEDFIAGLKPGVAARVEVPSLPEHAFTGAVTRIVPDADPRSRSLPVYVRIENRIEKGQPLISAGMFARVTLPVGRPTRAVLVPKDAIVLGGSSPRVFVVEAGKDGAPASVRPVSVELGVTDGGWIQVIGDVTTGTRVVTHGNERLHGGEAIIVVE